MDLWIIAPVCAIIGLLFAAFSFFSMKKEGTGTELMQKIAAAIHLGAMVYLKRQYTAIGIFVIAMAVVLAIAINPLTAGCFVVGASLSALAGYIGMTAATMANVRTTHAAKTGMAAAFRVSFSSGMVMGMTVVGLGLLGLSVVYFVVDTFTTVGIYEVINILSGFSLGASTQALFARVGGGIFTKAADVGADLVGKVEAGIPEDDPRNPATIADNLGDNVRDLAGIGADLYESYGGSILSTAALGAALPIIAGQADLQIKAIIAPMLVSAIGILLSIAGVYLVRTKEDASPKTLLRALLLGTGGSSALILVVLAVMAATGMITWGVFGAAVAGLAAGVIIGQSTEYFTSDGYKPTQGIADQSQQGPATVIIEGMAVGMMSTWVPVLT